MRLKDPHQLDSAITILANQSMLVGNTTSSGRDANAAREAWLIWWEQTDAQLRNLFIDQALADDLWRDQLEVQRLSMAGNPWRLLGRVVDVWRARLADVVTELKALKPFISRPGHIVVADTSALIEAAPLLDADLTQLAGVPASQPVRLIIPVVVIEELDGLRRFGRPQAREVAREVVRVLWDKGLPNGGFQTAHIGTSAEVFMDEPSHVRLPENDAEIVDRAEYVRELTGREVTLLASDLGILMRASAAGLTAARTPQ